MTTESNAFGWELIMRSIGDGFKSKEEVLVAFVHWNLIKIKLKCLGVGDSKILQPDEVGSELLPDNWNSSSPNFSLRYIHNDSVIVLNCLKCSDNIIFNLLDTTDLNVSNLAIDVEKTVSDLNGSLAEMMPSYSELTHKISSDLLKVIKNRTTKCAEVQTDPRKARESRMVVPRPYIYNPERPSRIPPRNPLEIGREDLNPLGNGAGGMIFDPFRGQNRRDPGFGVIGGMPRNEILQIARFDPIGPPRHEFERNNIFRPNRERRPDGDHIRPPDYDDMFM